MHPMPAFVLALGERLEIAVELFLLLGREQGTDSLAGLTQNVAALALEIVPQVLNLQARVLDDLKNLLALRRRQIQLALDTLDERLMRNTQPPAAVGEAARGEPDRETHDRNRYIEPAFASIRQDRHSPGASRVSAVPGNQCPTAGPFRKPNQGA
jgi:hypothetical protein